MQKYYVMAIKQHLQINALHLQSMEEKILPNIFPTIWSTKHFVDWVSANYNGYYIQGSSKLDKYGFSLLPTWVTFNEVRHVFKFLHKIEGFKLIFAFKF